MLDVIIIRPGCTTFDEAGRIKGSLDIPLSETGLAQAEKLSFALQTIKLDYLFVAPCLSAQMTAERIAERHFCKVKTLDWLRNLDHGLWQGKLLSEVKRCQPTFYRQFQDNPGDVGPPGGETVSQVLQRLQAPLNKLLRKHEGGRIGFLAPDPMATILQRCLDGGQLGDIWQLEQDSGSFEAIHLQSAESQLVLQVV
ncbi:MAG: histidine phosphatase family protein [Pirellulales bacterium]